MREIERRGRRREGKGESIPTEDRFLRHKIV
jgi:hypothetical protein